ncbi:MAG TPA: hypothetical protein VGF69_07420 [Thermoanaerobaculia bacterium]|jgi:hypothetical protein
MPWYTPQDLETLKRDELASFVAENVRVLTEEEGLAVLANNYITPQLCAMIAQNARLTGIYSIRLRLIAMRQTPLAQAMKFIHYLYWFDLVRLSIDVKVPAQVRRAIDQQLLKGIEKLGIGERVATARRCSPALIQAFLFDREPRVLESLLVNQRLREEDVLHLAGSPNATPEQLLLLSADRRWAFRYAVRKALVLNPRTPRSAAASQLRFLSKRDLRDIHANPQTSVYLRRCIERLTPQVFSSASAD